MMHHGELLDKIKRKGYRLTRQRKIILDEIINSRSHPGADEIFQRVKKRIGNISFGTVYRNLHVLKKLGLIMELNFGRNYSRYDGNPNNHQHFVCINCKKIYDIEQEVRIEIDEVKIDELDIKFTDFRLEFYGRCPDCRSSA